jgi:hypothetical protein
LRFLGAEDVARQLARHPLNECHQRAAVENAMQSSPQFLLGKAALDTVVMLENELLRFEFGNANGVSSFLGSKS